ncbi:MAG: hypothetical protein JWN03_8461 [Nocardia sp.]|uniref:hypothetical protein n=1 Tax=Nocardia sp. TaxID=1821 RepID=UPI0026037575|nr:hypothetical protein [Nocardia sp.]MCU1648186.1 hypothetical protein [Nocardia sp.]
MTQLVKVFTPIKRVPTMIGKAQNGQKLPFGPYTLHQVGGAVVLILITSVCTMNFPINPAVTFVTGAVFTVLAVFALGLVPYTGVRMTSRVLWIGRMIVRRKPVHASGVPIDVDSTRHVLFIEESLVVVLPESRSIRGNVVGVGSPRGTIAAGRIAAALDDGIGIVDPDTEMNYLLSSERSLE